MSSWRGLLLAPLLYGCIEPALDSDSTLTSARILTVIATPAEATPGATVRYRAIVASAAGELRPPLSWSFCTTPRAPADNAAASPDCVLNAERLQLGDTTEVTLTVPSDACSRFGSETPTTQAPNDSDESGGYYQPLRVALDAQNLAIVRQRIRCALPNAPIATAREYLERYVPNVAPAVASLRAYVEGREVPLDALPDSGELTLAAELAEGAQELYLSYDKHSGILTMREEVLTASWYVSAGALQHQDDTVTHHQLSATMSLPEGGLPFSVWLIVRDDRGGVSAETRVLRRAQASSSP